jgi:hypothetical protein
MMLHFLVRLVGPIRYTYCWYYQYVHVYRTRVVMQ